MSTNYYDPCEACLQANELATKVLIGSVLVNMFTIENVTYSQYSKNGRDVFVVCNSDSHPGMHEIDQECFFEAYQSNNVPRSKQDEATLQSAKAKAEDAVVAAEKLMAAAAAAYVAAKANQESALASSSASAGPSVYQSDRKVERSRRFGRIEKSVDGPVAVPASMLDRPLDDMIPQSQRDAVLGAAADYDECNGDSKSWPRVSKKQLDKELDQMVEERKAALGQQSATFRQKMDSMLDGIRQFEQQEKSRVDRGFLTSSQYRKNLKTFLKDEVRRIEESS